jgi:tetratricopeptide (TPR) repeat protein
MMEKASYLRADKIAEQGDNAKAAKEFEQFASSYKQSDMAAAARYKAAVNYEKAGDLVSASRMHGMVLAGDSSDAKVREIQNDSRNALAKIYQQTGQLELAAKSYRDYAAANPKDQKALNGYFNAAVLYDGMNMMNEAANAYNEYFARSKNADRVETHYLQAQMQKRRGNQARAASFFDRYIREGGRNMAHVIEANYEMAKNAKRLGQVTRTQNFFKEVIQLHKNAGKAKEATVGYAAEARFELAQPVLRDLAAIRFTKSDKQQAQAAAQLKTLREKYIAEMKAVVLFDNGPWIVAALASSGQMLDQVANQISRVPVPTGFGEADAAKYKELIQGQVNGIRTEAKSSYKAAIDKSQELEIYNSWTQAAREGIAAIDPSVNSRDAGEVAADTRAADWMGL